jgi:ankyrin repeat protein
MGQANSQAQGPLAKNDVYALLLRAVRQRNAETTDAVLSTNATVAGAFSTKEKTSLVQLSLKAVLGWGIEQGFSAATPPVEDGKEHRERVAGGEERPEVRILRSILANVSLRGAARLANEESSLATFCIATFSACYDAFERPRKTYVLLDSLRALLDAGIDVAHGGKADPLPPLHVACRRNLPTVVEFLLKAGGADPCGVGANDAHRNAPLHCAVIAGAADVIPVLLAHGGHLYQRTAEGDTVPSLAVEHVQLGSINAIRTAGRYALRNLTAADYLQLAVVAAHVAAEYSFGCGRCNAACGVVHGPVKGNCTNALAVLESVLDCGVFETVVGGHSVLHPIVARVGDASGGVRALTDEQCLSIMRVYEARGCNVLKLGAEDAETILHVAARRGAKETARFLVKAAGAPLEERAPATGDTPLLAALKAGQWATAEVLLSLGADAAARSGDAYKSWPIHIAVQGDAKAVAIPGIVAGDPDALHHATRDGFNAVHLAVMAGNTAGLAALLGQEGGRVGAALAAADAAAMAKRDLGAAAASTSRSDGDGEASRRGSAAVAGGAAVPRSRHDSADAGAAASAAAAAGAAPSAGGGAPELAHLRHVRPMDKSVRVVTAGGSVAATPLHIAFENHDWAAAELLVRAGARVDIPGGPSTATVERLAHKCELMRDESLKTLVAQAAAAHREADSRAAAGSRSAAESARARSASAEVEGDAAKAPGSPVTAVGAAGSGESAAIDAALSSLAAVAVSGPADVASGAAAVPAGSAR